MTHLNAAAHAGRREHERETLRMIADSIVSGERETFSEAEKAQEKEIAR